MKRTFVDMAERTWTFPALDLAAVKRVKAEVGFDLLDVADGTAVTQLVGNPLLMCDVVYSVLKPEAEKLGVSEADFASAMGGDSLDNATSAFLETFVDFFPNSRREVLRTALARIKEAEARTTTAAMKLLESEQLNQMIDQLINQRLGGVFAATTKP